LNRVTVRFVEAGLFQLREGVVLPVAERVARQMHAVQVLEVSRAMTRSPQEGEHKAASSREALREYARLLGDSPASREIAELEGEYLAMRASPSIAKQTVAAAYRRRSSTKDFTS
jgi:hypothetical protein